MPKCENLTYNQSKFPSHHTITPGSTCDAFVMPAGTSKAQLWLDSSVVNTNTTALTSCEVVLPGACSSIVAWLDSGAEPRYNGRIKAFNFNAPNGFGFISCPETFAMFSRDVYVHSSQIGNHRIGQVVSFAVSTNTLGQPQAKDISAAESLLWLGGKSSVAEADLETTTGASSDGASTSDVESTRDDDSNSSDGRSLEAPINYSH